MLVSILTGTERTQALLDFAQKVAQADGLDKINSKELVNILRQFVPVPRANRKEQNIELAEKILTELPDRQKVESSNIFELGQSQVLEQTADKLLACISNKDGYGVAALKILDYFGSEMLKKGYKPQTMRFKVRDLRNQFKKAVKLKYDNSVEFNRNSGKFETNNTDIETEIKKCNGVFCDIVSRLEGLYNVEVQEYTINQTKALKDKNQNTTVIDFSQFNSLIASVKQIVSGQCASKKTDWTRVVIFLCLVTGRRTVEVLSGYTNFTKVSEFEVLFKGHSKDKSETEREPYVIPTLVEADYVVAAFQWLDKFKKLDYPTNTSAMGLVEHRTKINNRVSKTLSQAIKTVNPKFTMHDLRKVYANTCRCFLYDKDTNPATENVYVASILGHGQEVDGKFVVDVNTTLSYSIYRVTNYTYR